MKKIHIAILMAVEAVLLCAGVAIAARNSSGTMVAINGPYTAGSVISSTAVNARLADIENELTNSVDKGGRTVMTAPLPLSNGTFALPSLTFGSDTDTGLYRIGANNLGVTANGAKVLDVATTGLGVTGTLSSTGAMSVTAAGATSAFSGLSGAAGSATDISVGRTAAEGRLGLSAAANNYATGSAAGDLVLGSLGHNIFLDSNSGSGTPSLQIVAANGGVKIGGGTTITASYRGTTSWTPGSITQNQCVTTTISLTGAAAGADCTVTPPSGTPVASIWYACSVTLNTCNLYDCNADQASAHTGPIGTYACRVFNP